MQFTEDRQTQVAPAPVHLRPYDQLALRDGLYYVRAYLGTGGFGHVYHIQAEAQPHSYALKLLRLWERPLDQQATLREIFAAEARVGTIASPHLVRTYRSGQLGGNPYLLMQYCPGGDLEQRSSQYSHETTFASLADQILQGLATLHQHGLLHRDLKPGNILFDAQDRACLADFGLATAWRDGAVATPHDLKTIHWRTALFSPPELLFPQRQTESLSPATDIFAFGVLAYYLLSGGHFPFGGQDQFERGRAQFFQHMRRGKWTPLATHRPDLSTRWATLVRRCLAYHPAERFADVAALRASLGQAPALPATATQADTPLGKRWHLRVVQGPVPAQVFDLTTLRRQKGDLVLTLGRHDSDYPACDLSLPAPPDCGLHPCHATLRWQGNRWHLQYGQLDAQQTWTTPEGGTFVNNQYIRQGELRPLYLGDLIRLGSITLRVEFAPPPMP